MAFQENEEYEKELEYSYNDEKYKVRDNGSVYRHRKEGKRKRPLDEKWTFGKPCKQKGYMNFSSETVHRIVATAFHGKQPSNKHIVDHIDTNKKNNRPENLRWITRLENILLNQITLSKIIYKYGSIDDFFANPSKPKNGELDQNFEWMRTVTKKESENTKQNLLKWANSGKLVPGEVLGDWVHSNLSWKDFLIPNENLITESLTKNAVQKNWKTPTEFPICPSEVNEKSIVAYESKLKEGATFSKNAWGGSKIVEFRIAKDAQHLFIICSIQGAKNWSLAKVYVDAEKIIHESLGSFFKLKGAKKQFTLALGLNWEGEGSIDDFY